MFDTLTNFVADALSRPTVSAIEYDAAINYKDLSTNQASDKEFICLRHSTTSNMEFRLLKTFDNVLVWCDIMTGHSRPYVTEKFRRTVFISLHGSGQPSHRATKPLINYRFVWHKMNSDIANWCRYCTGCQTVSHHNRPVFGKFEDGNNSSFLDVYVMLPVSQVSRNLLSHIIVYINRARPGTNKSLLSK